MICNTCKRNDPHIDQFLTEEDKKRMYYCGCKPLKLHSERDLKIRKMKYDFDLARKKD